MKRAIAVVAVLVGTLIATAPAEAASTSENEARKHSVPYVKKELPRVWNLGWKIRDCWRIPRGGVGYYNLSPRGVVCGFSSTKDTGYAEIPCYFMGVAVKDLGRLVELQLVDRAPNRWVGDPEYCEYGPGAPVMPVPRQWGINGNPL